MTTSLKTDANLKKCQAAAFRFLKVRLRSVEELRSKLVGKKKFDSEVIEETLHFLISHKFLDDALFAQQWIRYRLARPFGPKRIRFELQQKGVSKSIIERELDRALHSFREEDVVFELARKRAQKYQDLEKEKVKQRVFGYLSRRGFNSTLIYKAIQKL